VSKLVGHLLGTAFLFLSLVTIGWVVSYFLQYLDGVHAFPESTLRVMTMLELYLMYADSLLCLMVLGAGAFRFCKDILEVENEERVF
jgi:hypothetical protein